MKYIIFTESLKNGQIDILKKFTDVMLQGLLSNDSIYIDGIGTFYLKKDTGKIFDSDYDEVTLLFTEEKNKSSKKFDDLKNAAKCTSIVKLLTKYMKKEKEDVILDVEGFGLFTISSSIDFSQNKSFKKRITKYLEKSSPLLSTKKSKTVAASNRNEDNEDLVEYIGNDNDDYQAMESKKIKDYEELEEIVYDDYINKRDYYNSTNQENETISLKHSIENKNKETRNLFTENIEKALNSSKIKGNSVNKKEIYSKLFIVVCSIIIFAVSSGIILYFVTNTLRENKNKIDVNQSIYSIVEAFFKTYKSTTLSMKLTKDMYIWEISQEVYDNPLYWPMIYGANVFNQNPAKKIPKGSIITYKDLRIKGKYALNIFHRIAFNKHLSSSYMALYPIFLDYNEKIHALWALRLSSYFNSTIFESYKNTINKDLYNRVLEDTKSYGKRSF